MGTLERLPQNAFGLEKNQNDVNAVVHKSAMHGVVWGEVDDDTAAADAAEALLHMLPFFSATISISPAIRPLPQASNATIPVPFPHNRTASSRSCNRGSEERWLRE